MTDISSNFKDKIDDDNERFNNKIVNENQQISQLNSFNLLNSFNFISC